MANMANGEDRREDGTDKGDERGGKVFFVDAGEEGRRQRQIPRRNRQERKKRERKRAAQKRNSRKKKLIHCDEVRTGSLSHRNEADLEGRIEAERQGEKDVMN